MGIRTNKRLLGTQGLADRGKIRIIYTATKEIINN